MYFDLSGTEGRFKPLAVNKEHSLISFKTAIQNKRCNHKVVAYDRCPDNKS